MITITSTTLDFRTGRLTASLSVNVHGDGYTTNPDFSEADLLANAKAAGRTDWNSEDVLALASSALGVPALAGPPEPPVEVQPEIEPEPEAEPAEASSAAAEPSAG